MEEIFFFDIAQLLILKIHETCTTILDSIWTNNVMRMYFRFLGYL